MKCTSHAALFDHTMSEWICLIVLFGHCGNSEQMSGNLRKSLQRMQTRSGTAGNSVLERPRDVQSAGVPAKYGII